MADVSITWLGHASFRLDTPGGKRIYIDPWLDNPKCPAGEKAVERADLVVLTHGHSDHVGSAAGIARGNGAAVVAMVELADWLDSQGVSDNLHGINKGGTVEVDGVKVTMTDARHSSSCPDGTYAGEAAGVVIELENGTKVYHAGDTCAFGDMQLIGRIHEPDVAIVPIGDYFTMGPREAAVALELLGVKRCIPCHYGTFPLLTGTPDELRRFASGVEVIAPEPGETVEV
jgi:L-ascorbate metabolism protein UlaG (beta-lactamase superfamily)